MSRRSFVTALGLLSCASIATAQPVVRANVSTRPPLIVGQQIRIDVQVLVPNFFMGSPKFPVLDVPGAVVTLTDDAVNLNDTIQGQSYAGIQRTYLFVASAAGRFELPPARIEVAYAATPGQPAARTSVALPATVLDIGWPAGIAPADVPPGMLVARVAVNQRLDRDPGTLHAGDALTRTIETTVAATQSMLIPPPKFDAPADVKVYARDPVLADQQSDRGGLVGGHRTDSAVYVFPRPGTYVLPAIDVPWFDVSARRRQTASAPEIAVTVAAATAAGPAIAPEQEPPSPPPNARRTGRWWQQRPLALAEAAVVAALWVLWTRLPRWRARYQAAQKERAQSEAGRFARFRNACLRRNAADAYVSLLAWAQVVKPAAIDWRLSASDDGFRDELQHLEARLYSGAVSESSWDGTGLAAAAARVRNRWLASGGSPPPGRRLPPLNPALPSR